MIELLGFMYCLGRDLLAYAQWDEEEKLVDFHWPEKSGFSERAKAKGLNLSWVSPHKVASKQIEGREIMYEIDTTKRVRRKLVLRDGLVLMGHIPPETKQ